jgi:FMN phosphatase YigB (HAD superfamily)
MSFECIVLDFDGTFTLVDREAVPFVQGFVHDLEGLVGPSVIARWDATVRRVKSDPDRYGWEYDEHIVAPSHADPYILATTVGQILLAEHGVSERAERTKILEALYQRNYPKSSNVFRPDAREVVDAIVRSAIPVFVVTNSQTRHVEAKLDELAPEGRDQLVVRGAARKFVLTAPETPDEAWSRVPAELHVPGLSRPIFLGRGAYYDALRRIWNETGASPETTLVCGDIFELDLALPAELGAGIHLVARPDTPEYERRAARASANGSVSQELSGLLERLDLPG